MKRLTIGRRLILAGLALACILGFASTPTAQAGGGVDPKQVPITWISIGEETEKWWYSPDPESYVPRDGGGYELDSPKEFNVLDNRATLEIEELAYDADPFVLNNYLITNNTALTQLYNVFVGLPTSFGAANLISGNVRASVIDGGLDGATLATIGGISHYRAQIDGATVATLQDDPFSVVAPVAGSDTKSATFGPTLNLIPVTTDIGITLRFTLTPGDTAGILSRFDVVVPEPSGIFLGTLAFVAICVPAARRFRRR